MNQANDKSSIFAEYSREQVYQTDIVDKNNKRKYRLQKSKKMAKKTIRLKALLTTLIFVATGGGVVGLTTALSKINTSEAATSENFVSDSMEIHDFYEPEINVNKYSSEQINQNDFSDINHDAYDIFNVGSSDQLETVKEFLNGPNGYYIYKYSKDYGVDPNLIVGMCMQESSLEHERCCPGGDRYSGFGVGLMELESPSGQSITAYNYNTSSYDTVDITMENACNIATNIQLGCMIFQNSLEKYNGNIYLSVQSHNYGQGMLDSILSANYDDVEKIKNDYTDITWLPFIEEAHYNPLKYISEWEHGTYGDENYVSNVLRFCPSDEVSYVCNGQTVIFNLKTMQVENEDSNVKTN